MAEYVDVAFPAYDCCIVMVEDAEQPENIGCTMLDLKIAIATHYAGDDVVLRSPQQANRFR